MLRITTLIALTTACAMESPVETTETIQFLPSLGDTCPTWGCGENSPVMGPFGNWWDLHFGGQANNDRLVVEGFFLGNQRLTPSLRGTQLVGSYRTLPLGTTVRLSGTHLTGAYFRIRAPSGEIFQLIIKGVNPLASSPVTYWVGPPTQIETYELTWNHPGEIESSPICTNPPERTSGEGPGRFWHRQTEAILFTGDRYSEDKQVSLTDTSGWMNIACAGSVLAKLVLNRHTTAGSTSTYVTTADQRQAMLKMYVSDVCGTGNAWTTAGTKLRFQQNQTATSVWTNLDGHEYRFEAQWGPHGAVCFDSHRRGTEYLPHIALDCGASMPAPCGNNPGDFVAPSTPPFLAGAYIASAVPDAVP